MEKYTNVFAKIGRLERSPLVYEIRVSKHRLLSSYGVQLMHWFARLSLLLIRISYLIFIRTYLTQLESMNLLLCRSFALVRINTLLARIISEKNKNVGCNDPKVEKIFLLYIHQNSTSIGLLSGIFLTGKLPLM